MDHCSDPAGTESCNMQIRWETNSSTMQVHIHGQWMLPSLMHSFVGQSSIRELCPPALVLERERTEGRKREKFYIYLDVTHTHFFTQTLLRTDAFTHKHFYTNFKLYTWHSTLYTPHLTLYTVHASLHTPHSTLYTSAILLLCLTIFLRFLLFFSNLFPAVPPLSSVFLLRNLP